MIVAAREKGMSTKCAAETFNVTERSVQKFVAQQRDKGTLEPRSCVRQPSSRKIDPEHEKQLCEQLSQHPDATIEEHRELWLEKTGQSVSWSTMRQSILRSGWTHKKNLLRPGEVTASAVRIYAPTSTDSRENLCHHGHIWCQQSVHDQTRLGTKRNETTGKNTVKTR